MKNHSSYFNKRTMFQKTSDDLVCTHLLLLKRLHIDDSVRDGSVHEISL